MRKDLSRSIFLTAQAGQKLCVVLRHSRSFQFGVGEITKVHTEPEARKAKTKKLYFTNESSRSGANVLVYSRRLCKECVAVKITDHSPLGIGIVFEETLRNVKLRKKFQAVKAVVWIFDFSGKVSLEGKFGQPTKT